MENAGIPEGRLYGKCRSNSEDQNARTFKLEINLVQPNCIAVIHTTSVR